MDVIKCRTGSLIMSITISDAEIWELNYVLIASSKFSVLNHMRITCGIVAKRETMPVKP